MVRSGDGTSVSAMTVEMTVKLLQAREKKQVVHKVPTKRKMKTRGRLQLLAVHNREVN